MSFPVMIDPVVREVLHLWYSQLCAGTQSRVVKSDTSVSIQMANRFSEACNRKWNVKAALFGF